MYYSKNFHIKLNILNYYIEIDDFLLDRTHPALDNDAKWNIEEIFVNNLGAPFFTNEDISS
jgi:hypothetical protein